MCMMAACIARHGFGRFGFLVSQGHNRIFISSSLTVTGARDLQKCDYHSSCRLGQRVSASHQQQADAAGTGKPWRLASAVCLERFPVVSQEMGETEQRYFDMTSVVELEKSALSQHEVAVAADRNRMAKKQAGEQGEDDDEDNQGGDLLTALDIEDLATEELARFKNAPRVTDVDEKDDRRSLNRKLADKLVLLVKCKLGADSVWMLPYGLREEGENMKETAQRALSDHADGGGLLRALFMGNAPVGFLKQRFPKTVQEETGSAGVKVFFFKAQHLNGEFQKSEESPKVEDYLWVSRDELDQYLEESYLHCVQKFILPV